MKKFERLRAKLREKVERRELVVAPGAYDALSARVIERAGFEAVYMTGHGTGAGMLAWSDVGLTTMTEMVWNAKNICNAVDLPVIADMDTGYGNALNVIRAVREFEQAGVAGFHLEDQVSPKKCGFMKGKLCIPLDEMVGKIEAAAEVREDPNLLIITRCDARAPLGAEEMYRRCEVYRKAGADVIFPEAPLTEEDIRKDSEWGKRIGAPLLLNGVKYGLNIPDIAALRYAILILPLIAFAVAPKAVYDVLRELKETGRYADLEKQGKAFPFEVIQELLRLPEVKKYEEKFLPREERMARWGSEEVPLETFRGLGSVPPEIPSPPAGEGRDESD
jgi:2-methylisocitrate lyase-like PEP mutase family enzyme